MLIPFILIKFMKLRPAISVGRTAVPTPPKLTISSSSSFLRRVFGSTSPPFVTVRISPRNACCFIVRRSFGSNSTVEPAKEDQNFVENKIVDEKVSYNSVWALSNLGFTNFPLIMLAYAGLGWIAEAMEMMLLSFVGPAIQPEWGLSSEQESFISTVTFGGMLVGAYMWGVVSDTYGRKKGFLGASIMTTTCGLLSAFAPNYTSLLILRFFIGVGLGCGHVFSSWFLEFVPSPNRGTWMVVFSTFWTVGTIIEASLAWAIMPSIGWRWLLGLSTIPSLLVLLFYDQVPESPRYLCTKRKLTEARFIMEKGTTLNRKELPNGTLVSDHINQADKTRSSSISLLLSPNLIRTTLPLWILYFGNTFSYYGIVLLTSQLSILQSESIQNSSLYTNVFVNSLAELPGLGLAAIILDKLGRKISMELMFVVAFVLLLPLVVHDQNDMLTTTSLFGARMFISASFIVACIYSPEVYPTNIRATGVGIATAVGRIGGMVCPLVAVGLVSSCSQTLAVMLFEAMILVSGLCVVLLPLETKGRDLTDEVE
ncbi:organic cation/carnitine transporter 7-like [Bidens hawaiensis]|uniref:organic cation/carnitine transporter 7-like n=1 Tax=Bidens hawaiensis TaxID=980011 RepID=UPI004048F685